MSIRSLERKFIRNSIYCTNALVHFELTRLTFRVQKQLFWQGGLQFALEVTPSVYLSTDREVNIALGNIVSWPHFSIVHPLHRPQMSVRCRRKRTGGTIVTHHQSTKAPGMTVVLARYGGMEPLHQ